MRANSNNKIRKSTKYIGVIISIVLLITSISSLVKNIALENTKTKTELIYNYTNQFNYDYNVNLVNNKYIQSINKEDNTIAYVTDLMDTTDLNLKYQYTADKTTNLKYTYSIIGKLQATYAKDREEKKIIEQEEVILQPQTNEIESNQIDINENLQIDLKSKNALLEEFKKELEMSISAKYNVILKINIQTDIEQEPVEVKYEPSIQIDLANKTTKITGENNKKETEQISKQYNETEDINLVVIFIDIIILITAIILLKYILQAKTTNRVKNEYRRELNKILKMCQDKIVQISTKPHESAENEVYVKDFAEIYKVSEELFKPILYYFDNEQQEAWFTIITEDATYRYILKG